MAEIFYSPCAPVRYAHLITAGLYEGKYSYSVELLLSPDTNPEHKAFIDKLEAEFVALHGTKKARSEKGTPWKKDKNDPSIVIVKFKSNRFENENEETGAITYSKGPRIVDARRNQWNGSDIGNGSEMIIGFRFYPWTRNEGCGVQLRPKACQVVKFVPYEGDDAKAVDGFEEQEGYTVAAGDLEDDGFGF